MIFKDLNEVKTYNDKAYNNIIKLWAELSRVSFVTAKRYLIEDYGFRYLVENRNGQIILIDKDQEEEHAIDK